jgi:4-diphosphocytidyl-2-C-methyl-D-erythritol kinase
VVVEKAPAKVNLYLHVVGRRADGYHLLDSLVAFAELGDAVTAAPSDALRLVVEGPFAAALKDEPDNLVLRAARRLAAAAGVTRGAAITLTKNLPVASGIGGGSADAAAALRALCRLWKVAPGAVPLDAIALELGADVPACLDGRTAFIGGLGERREAAPPLPPADLVLVNPLVPLATHQVFARRAGDFSSSAPWRFPVAPPNAAALAEILQKTRNDLTPPAFLLLPVVRDVLDALSRSQHCLLARMSGSGATCFGIYPDGKSAGEAAQGLARARPDWWVAPTRLRPANAAE